MNKHIEYEIQGTGIPFVFLHGLGGDMQQIYSAYDPIEGIQLININMQGHGQSLAKYETLDFNIIADDVISILNELNISNAIIGGISMGAAIAINVAIRYPSYVSKLLLVRPAWTHEPMSHQVQLAYSSLANALSHNDIHTFINSEGWNIVNQTTNYTRNTFLHTFEEEVNIQQWQKFAILPYKTPHNSISDIENLNIYTTIIACRNDFVHPYEYAEEYHQYIPNSILIEIPNKDVDPKLHNQMINTILKERLKVNP